MTHDSIGLGEDGPTHQPVEVLELLRATPNINTFRPADGNEVSSDVLYWLNLGRRRVVSERAWGDFERFIHENLASSGRKVLVKFQRRDGGVSNRS